MLTGFLLLAEKVSMCFAVLFFLRYFQVTGMNEPVIFGTLEEALVFILFLVLSGAARITLGHWRTLED